MSGGQVCLCLPTEIHVQCSVQKVLLNYAYGRKKFNVYLKFFNFYMKVFLVKEQILTCFLL